MIASTEGQTLCDRCSRQSRRPGAAVFGVDNNLVPGPVPPELMDLTAVEELLIARVLAVTSVHRLPLGQIGYRGHAIFFPQDIAEVAATLPRTTVNIIVLKRRSHDALTTNSFPRTRSSGFEVAPTTQSLLCRKMGRSQV